MRQQFVEFLLAQHRAQCGLSELRGLVHVVRDFDHCFIWINDSQKDDGVDFQCHVVTGDDVLRRDFEGFLAEGNAHDPVNRREDQDDTRPLCLCQQMAEAEDDATLILGQDLDGTQHIDDDDHYGNYEEHLHSRLPEYENASAADCIPTASHARSQRTNTVVKGDSGRFVVSGQGGLGDWQGLDLEGQSIHFSYDYLSPRGNTH